MVKPDGITVQSNSIRIGNNKDQEIVKDNNGFMKKPNSIKIQSNSIRVFGNEKPKFSTQTKVSRDHLHTQFISIMHSYDCYGNTGCWLPQKWAELAVQFSWQLQNGTQDFIFFNCHGCQTFILAEIHWYLSPHIFWTY